MDEMKIKNVFNELPYYETIRVAKKNGKVCVIEDRRNYYFRERHLCYMVITYSEGGDYQYESFGSKFMANRFFNKIVKRYDLNELSEFDKQLCGEKVIYNLVEGK